MNKEVGREEINLIWLHKMLVKSYLKEVEISQEKFTNLSKQLFLQLSVESVQNINM